MTIQKPEIPTARILGIIGMSDEASAVVAKEYPTLTDLLVSYKSHTTEESLRAEFLVLRQENESFKNGDINRMVLFGWFIQSKGDGDQVDWEQFNGDSFNQFIASRQLKASNELNKTAMFENDTEATQRTAPIEIQEAVAVPVAVAVAVPTSSPVQANKMDREQKDKNQTNNFCNCGCGEFLCDCICCCLECAAHSAVLN